MTFADLPCQSGGRTVRRALSTIRTSASRQPDSNTLAVPSNIHTQWPMLVKPISKPKNGIAAFAVCRLGASPAAQVVSPITATFRLVVEGSILSTDATISALTLSFRNAGRSKYLPSGRTTTNCPSAAFARAGPNLSSAFTASIVTKVTRARPTVAIRRLHLKSHRNGGALATPEGVELEAFSQA